MMGTCTYLICDVCKSMVFVGKSGIYADNFKNTSISSSVSAFLLHHWSGDYGEIDKVTDDTILCHGNFMIMSENLIPSEKFQHYKQYNQSDYEPWYKIEKEYSEYCMKSPHVSNNMVRGISLNPGLAWIRKINDSFMRLFKNE